VGSSPPGKKCLEEDEERRQRHSFQIAPYRLWVVRVRVMYSNFKKKTATLSEVS
jgi:hypothetical protein